MKYTLASLYFVLFITTPHPIACAETDDPLRLEGVVYEDSAPESSLAVINGVTLAKGRSYGSHTVKEIQKDSVTLSDSAGHEKILKLSAKPVPTPSASAEAPSPAPTAPEADVPPLINLPFNPAALIEKALNIKVLADMKNLHMQAMIYYSEHDKIAPIDKLIEEGALNPAFKDGIKGDYKFRLDESGRGVLVYADPVNAASKRPHYMIDDWGNMRWEKDGPANSKSPLYDH